MSAQGVASVARLFNVPPEAAIVILAGTSGERAAVESVPARTDTISEWVDTEQVTLEQIAEAHRIAKRAVATGEWPTGTGINVLEAQVVLAQVLALHAPEPTDDDLLDEGDPFAA